VSSTTPTTERDTDRLQRLEKLWSLPRPAVMGILNCTPDSFADGGRFLGFEEAVRHGEQLMADGADIVDIGGESTRPGAEPVAAEEEISRVGPVLKELRHRHPRALLSIDTVKAEVAEIALGAGADLVNDVNAGRDPGMLPAVAGHNAGIVLMHMRGSPRTMQQNTGYADVVAEVTEHLRRGAAAAMAAGIPAEAVWLDPGIGFGKDDSGNLALLAALPDLATLGHPIVIGPSQKSFIGRITGADVGDRLPGTLGALTTVLECPRAVVRVHDVRSAVQYLQIAGAIRSTVR
jgi:dihydropteroate synthase